MTDPRKFNRLADELDGWHDCADGDVSAGNGHFRIVCVSDSEQQRLNLRATLREAASALRTAAAASSSGAVKVKPLSDAQWLKKRTAESGVVLKNSDRTRFLENIRFAERHIVALIPEPAKAGDAVLLREALSDARNALVALRTRLKTEPSVQGRGWISLGNVVHNAIDKADRALSTTAPQPDNGARGDGGTMRKGLERACSTELFRADEMEAIDAIFQQVVAYIERATSFQLNGAVRAGIQYTISPLAANLLAMRPKRLAAANQSDGGSRKQPFDPADAAGVKSGTVTFDGQTGRPNRDEVGASQIPGSSMSFAADKPIVAGQAPGPSDTAPAEPVAMLGGIHGVALLRHIQSMLPEAQKAYHTPLFTHPPRSVDVEAVKRALIAAKCDTGDGTYVHCSMDQAARSIARMIEGE